MKTNKRSDYLTGKKKLKNTVLKRVRTSALIPPHDVSLDECRGIIRSLRKEGWTRRPLLGFHVGRKVQCVTGSHRVKSARKVGRKTVPVFIIDPKLVDRFKRQGLDKKEICPFFYDDYRASRFGTYIGYDQSKVYM